MNRTLYIRADADTTIGTGHVMRCIALGQEWRKTVGGPVVFLGRIDSSALHERIRLEDFSLVDVPAVHPDRRDARFVIDVLSRTSQEAPQWLVLDGYHFDTAYQEKLFGKNCRILLIDDNALLPAYHCDILLNQNIFANGLTYRGKDGMVRMLGPRYALLRNEFQRISRMNREAPPIARKILVTLGGGDKQNVTARILAALAELDVRDFQVKAVMGTANPHEASLSKLVDGLPFRCALIPPTNDMVGLMQWADMAITAAGTTTYELAACGVPFITLVTADNQEMNAMELAKHGLSINLGRFEALEPTHLTVQLQSFLHDLHQRQAQSRAGQDLVDGRGAGRVVKAMLSTEFSLRPAQWADKDLLLEWANDPQTRKNSFHSETILREEHEKWLAAKLNDPDCHMFVAMSHEVVPIGVVRFDVTGDKALISVNLAKQSRGKGFGDRILTKACKSLFNERPVSVVEALVKEENISSLRTFRKAGFAIDGKMMQGDVPVMILHRYR